MVVLIAAAISSLLMSVSVSRPILILAKHAEKLAEGKLDEKISSNILKLENEIGILARSFNVMAENLQGIYKSLEKKVKQRTRQLQVEKDKFQGVFDASAIGIAIVGIKGEWIEVNDALPKIIGTKKKSW